MKFALISGSNSQVFLDKDCLQDGQSWLAGFVQVSLPHTHCLSHTHTLSLSHSLSTLAQGVVVSMVFVPLLSWTEVSPNP